MHKNSFLILSILPLLAGCGAPSDKEIGQAVLSISPVVFFFSASIQFIIFNGFTEDRSKTSRYLLYNITFFVVLFFISLFFGNPEHQNDISFIYIFIYFILFLVIVCIISAFSRKLFIFSSMLTMTFFVILSLIMILSQPPSYRHHIKGGMFSRPHVNLKLAKN